MNTRTTTINNTRKWTALISCLLISSLSFVGCNKDKQANKTEYSVNLQKIDGGDTLCERKPWISWKLNVTPLAGSYSEFKMAIVENGETAVQALEKHGKTTKILSGSSFQYVQGYPLLDKKKKYAYKVDVTPGTGLAPVSSAVYTTQALDADMSLWSDDLAVNFLANVNIHTDAAGNIAVDASWLYATANPAVRVDIMEVDCCNSFFPDTIWVGPKGEWPWYGCGGHMEGGHQPVCKWQLEHNRQDAFANLSFPIVFTTTQNIAVWTGSGNTTIGTTYPYDPYKCYLIAITDVATGWKNTFYVTGNI